MPPNEEPKPKRCHPNEEPKPKLKFCHKVEAGCCVALVGQLVGQKEKLDTICFSPFISRRSEIEFSNLKGGPNRGGTENFGVAPTVIASTFSQLRLRSIIANRSRIFIDFLSKLSI